MSEIARIADQLRRAHQGDAWHGPALREVLDGLTAARAAARPLPGAHTIWEIVLHIAAWEGIVARRLRGERVEDVTPDEDWPPARDTSEAAWREAVAQLERGHERLEDGIAGFSDARLGDKTPAGTPYYDLLHGIVQHDLYHAGQIAILKKERASA
jgi:uncharacterized damage-inducible protein DinB